MVKKEKKINTALLMHIILSCQEIWRKYSSKVYLVGKPKTVAPEMFINHSLLKKNFSYEKIVVSNPNYFD